MDEGLFPDVKTYLSVHLYLQDCFAARKKSGKFSYQNWADALGINSRGYLRLAAYGKRNISEELGQKLAAWLQLQGIDHEYFLILILHSQASQQEQKKFFAKKLIQLLKREMPLVEISAHEDLLAEPLHLVVRNILSYSDIPTSVDFLARLLGLTEEKILTILLQLEAGGFVEEVDQQWKAVHDSVQIRPSAGSQSLRNYHKKSLIKALEAQNLPSELRSYRSLSLALRSEEYREYLEDLSEFAQKVFAKYSSSELKEKRLYQMNFNVFPWTEKVE